MWKEIEEGPKKWGIREDMKTYGVDEDITKVMEG